MNKNKSRAFSKLLNTVNEADLEEVTQHEDVRLEFEGLVYVGCEPFQPSDLIVISSSEGTKITGKFGFDCFVDHKITFLLEDGLHTVSKVEDVPEVVHNFTSFNFDPTHDKTFTFCFLDSNGQRHKRYQSVHGNRLKWLPILKELMKREVK